MPKKLEMAYAGSMIANLRAQAGVSPDLVSDERVLEAINNPENSGFGTAEDDCAAMVQEIKLAAGERWLGVYEEYALAEGWNLWDHDGTGLMEIKFWGEDPNNRFKSDEAAVAFVRQRAAEGSPRHQIAVVMHDRDAAALAAYRAKEDKLNR